MFRGVVVAGAIGGTFALGLAVGDRPVASDSTHALDDATDTLLALADRETARYDEVKRSLRLTFHDELTDGVALAVPSPTRARPDTAPSAKPAPPAPTVDKRAADAPAVDAAGATEARRAPPRVVDAAPAAPPAAPVADEHDDESPADRATRLRLAFAQLGGAPTARVDAAPSDRATPAPAAAPSSSRYVVQVASFPSLEGARALAARLEQDGRRARVVSADVAGQGTVHRVQVTGFSSVDAAERVRGEIKRGLGLDGLVRKDG